MKITYKQIDDAALARHNETIKEGKNLLKWIVIWWSVCAAVSFIAMHTQGVYFSTIALIATSIFLVRIGNMLCEISVNIRTTIRQNDDLRLLILTNTVFEKE
jgi:hypothetical protein